MQRITLTCSSCGKALGTIDLANLMGHVPAHVRAMITGPLVSTQLDVRCSTCEAKHGT